MAKKPAAAPAPSDPPQPEPAIDPAAQYRITVSQVIAAGGVKLRPRHVYEVRGAVAETVQAADALATIERLA